MDDKKVKEILEGIKKESFVDDYKASDTEAMGMLLSKYFKWNGIAIMDASCYGLEDANFHTECSQIRELIEETKSAYNQ